jgi:hypothetical protein
MRIRAIAVFESVIYNCYVVDASRPERPLLEVDALLRPGDADEGPLLLPVPTYMALVGGPELAEPYLRALSSRGRLVDRQGVKHLSFPTWEPVDPSAPLGDD